MSLPPPQVPEPLPLPRLSVHKPPTHAGLLSLPERAGEELIKPASLVQRDSPGQESPWQPDATGRPKAGLSCDAMPAGSLEFLPGWWEHGEVFTSLEGHQTPPTLTPGSPVVTPCPIIKTSTKALGTRGELPLPGVLPEPRGLCVLHPHT